MRARGARLCALALAMAAVTACERDSYDKGTSEHSLATADFVEAHTDSGRQVTCAVTDGGRRLTLTPPLAPIWATVADTAYRAILYYNRGDGDCARPLSITPVAVLAPKPRAELKQVKTDPLTFESAWMSCGGKYLNVGLYLKTGEATGGDRPRHTLGAVSEGARQNADGTRTALLTLYHDQGGVPEHYSSKHYASILCGDIPCDSIALTVSTYKGKTVKTVAAK